MQCLCIAIKAFHKTVLYKLKKKKGGGWGVYAIAILFHFRHCGKSFAGETAAKFMKVQPGERSGTKTVSM